MSHGANPGDDAAALLETLAETMQRQLSMVQTGRLDEMDELADSTEAMANRASQISSQELAHHSSRIKHIRTLRRSILLALAAQKDALAHTKGRVRKGKHMLTAYNWPGATGRRDAIRLQDTSR